MIIGDACKGSNFFFTGDEFKALDALATREAYLKREVTMYCEIELGRYEPQPVYPGNEPLPSQSPTQVFFTMPLLSGRPGPGIPGRPRGPGDPGLPGPIGPSIGVPGQPQPNQPCDCSGPGCPCDQCWIEGFRVC